MSNDKTESTVWGVPLGGRLTNIAIATVAFVTGGVLVGLSPAAAANRSTLSTASTEARYCREVIRSSIPVYASATGRVVRGRFYHGDVFQHFGRVHGRYQTWLPRGVPRPHGYTAYAASSGSRPVRCPW
ncbi:hypothetical protein GCM10010201_25140 [Pilimelia columellifera subsp. columellifera]|uniref:Uncharacterized protein n=1 Tax=Pilimelia columellifera subsp. columellifera TaxID=706583 RepID=A0ABN3NLT1_9ACTN